MTAEAYDVATSPICKGNREANTPRIVGQALAPVGLSAEFPDARWSRWSRELLINTMSTPAVMEYAPLATILPWANRCWRLC